MGGARVLTPCSPPPLSPPHPPSTPTPHPPTGAEDHNSAPHRDFPHHLNTTTTSTTATSHQASQGLGLRVCLGFWAFGLSWVGPAGVHLAARLGSRELGTDAHNSINPMSPAKPASPANPAALIYPAPNPQPLNPKA